MTTLSVNATAIDLRVIRQVSRAKVCIGSQLFQALNLQIVGYPMIVSSIDPHNIFPIYFEVEGQDYRYTVAAWTDRVQVEFVCCKNGRSVKIKEEIYCTQFEFMAFVTDVLTLDYLRAQST